MADDPYFDSLGRAEDTLWQLLAVLRDGGDAEAPSTRGRLQSGRSQSTGGGHRASAASRRASFASGSELPSYRSGGPSLVWQAEQAPLERAAPVARRAAGSLRSDRDLDEGIPAFVASATIGMSTQEAMLQTLQGLHSRLCAMTYANDLPADPRLKAQLQEAAGLLGQLVTYVGGRPGAAPMGARGADAGAARVPAVRDAGPEHPAQQPRGPRGPELALREELDQCQAQLRRQAAELQERQDECDALQRELASTRRQLLCSEERAAAASGLPSPLALPTLQSATAGTGATDSLPGSACAAGDPRGLRAGPWEHLDHRWREPDEEGISKARHQQVLPAIDAVGA